jgi:hypothetical protein
MAFEKTEAGCILASMALLTKYYPQFLPLLEAFGRFLSRMRRDRNDKQPFFTFPYILS